MSKKVIVTGCTGQAGSLMVEYLLKNTDYEIYGMVRRLSVNNHKNIDQLKNNSRFHLFSGDLTDGPSLQKSVDEIKPDFYINAAAQSFVAESWISPVGTFQSDAVAIIYILEAIRKFVPNCRFINFASSEMFGDTQYSPQDINHPFRSRSPYAAAKVAAHQIVKVYRESYNLYCLSAICFNYEGKNRGLEFITRKISNGVARIYHAIQNNQNFEPIFVGNIESKRDWSNAEDIVDGIWMMLNQEKYRKMLMSSIALPLFIKEYILASGETNSVKEFIEASFREAGIVKYRSQKEAVIDNNHAYWAEWVGQDELAQYLLYKDDGNVISFRCLVAIDRKFYRPNEVNELCGDSTPIRNDLGWNPKSTFDNLVKEMVSHDIAVFNQ